MEDPVGAVHKPTVDYYRHPSGTILPLPVREQEVADRQRDIYLQKKAEDKEIEQQEIELIKKDTEADAYDPDANPYEGIAYRNDFDFWFGGIADASPEEANAFSTKKSKGEKPDVKPDSPQQQDQVQDKKSKPAFKGKVKRVPGSLGRVFEPRQFDINMCKSDFTYVFYGRRRSGKSFLMRWLL